MYCVRVQSFTLCSYVDSSAQPYPAYQFRLCNINMQYAVCIEAGFRSLHMMMMMMMMMLSETPNTYIHMYMYIHTTPTEKKEEKKDEKICCWLLITLVWRIPITYHCYNKICNGIDRIFYPIQ